MPKSKEEIKEFPTITIEKVQNGFIVTGFEGYPKKPVKYCCHTVNELICRIEHIWKVKLIKLDESEKTATCLEEFIEVTKVKQ